MCTAGRSPSRRWRWRAVRAGGAGSAPPLVSRCANGWSSLRGSKPSLCSRGRPVGGSWSRRSSVPAMSRVSPIPLRRPPNVAASSGRRPTTSDCELQLRLLLAGELPEAWVPPVQILELRTRVRLRKTLIDQRTAWLQRLQAQLFHQGVPPGLKPRTAAGRDALARVELSRAGREAVELCLRMLDQLDRELVPIDRALRAFARRQPGCRALAEQLYGVGAVTATAILAELGDARRFTSSDDAVRHSGLDVTVWQSDRKRAAGHL